MFYTIATRLQILVGRGHALIIFPYFDKHNP